MYQIEKDFEHNGLRCVITFTPIGYRCGYVGIPKTHSLYGKDYRDYLEIKKEDIKDREITGIFPLLEAIIDEDERFRIDSFFNCHGGITYAGGGVESKYPVESDLWWFGFDCAHLNDGIDLDCALVYFPELSHQILMRKQFLSSADESIKTREYVEEQCKNLADQLVSFNKC